MHVSVAELIQREGAIPPPQVIRWLAEVCDALDALSAAGTWSDVEVDQVLVSRDATEVAVVQPRPLELANPPARWQLRQVGALGYQMLKAAPPQFPLTEQAFEGIPSDLARLLVEALSGTGPATAKELGAALRAVRVQTQSPKRQSSDTVLKARKSLDKRDRSGELFGQFELVQLLGEGGMGDVYLARHVRLAREVAIKLLKPEFAAIPDLVQRFFQEANVVNEIRHPHIVQVQDFVEEPGRVYCVMELLEGMNLADLAEREGPLSLGRIAFITVQVCDALHAAHLREVVHRDIKPENVFVSRGPDGGDFARVLDFGIARRSAAGTGTQQGAVMGTPLYMAPEQAAGRAVDARADLYSVGVMLFELLACRSISEVATTELPKADGRGNPIPADLRALVDSLLALDPKGRPGSADEVRVRLLPHARSATSSGLIPGAPVRPSAPHAPTGVALQEAGLTRTPWKPVAGLAVVVLLLAAALVAFTRSIATKPAPPPIPVVKSPEPPPKVEPPPVVVKVEEPVKGEEPPEPPPPVVKVVKVEEPKPGPGNKKKKVPGKVEKKEKVEVAALASQPAPAVGVPNVKVRVKALRERFQALSSSPNNRLTSLDKYLYQQVLDEESQGLETVKATSLEKAEKAVEAAAARSSQ